MLELVEFDRGAAGKAPLHATIHPADVHKVSELSQLVTKVQEAGNGYEFTVVGPRRLARVSGSTDLLWGAECLREACIYLAHTRHGVPRDSAFIMTEFDLHELEGLGVHLPTLRATTTQLGTGCRPRRIRIQGDFLVNGAVAATADGVADVLSRGAYHRLRRGSARESQAMPKIRRLDPASAGAATSADVLVAEDGAGALYLAVDTNHPVYFDHPTDHVPGMVLAEAAAQAVRARLGNHATQTLRATFAQFVELGQTCEIRVQSYGRSATACAYQAGSIAAEFIFGARPMS